MADLHHECGIVAVYHLPHAPVSPLVPQGRRNAASRLMPRMLLDIQNRGQLAAGMSVYRPQHNELIDTHKDVGSVTEVFELSHPEAYSNLMDEYEGPVAIGHVRYATCGKDDRSYAQPFERHHLEKRKWFSFGFNGQLANFLDLRDRIRSQGDFHLSRETDTETLMHLMSQEISRQARGFDAVEMLTSLSRRLDGAYNIVFLNAQGDMFVARDPLGIRPLCYAFDGSLFAAASESVALTNLGFTSAQVHDVPPGHAIIIEQGQPLPNGSFEPIPIPYARTDRRAHCFFEWIYFANVCSTLDDHSVYLSRKRLGEELAAQEQVPIDDDTIVVPVPDTAKAAADAMAYALRIPCLEGLMRNRYVGRTFIEGAGRAEKARVKYTPLPEVLKGKKVLLVEDTIVRSTTMKVLVSQLRERGQAKEIHVRVACPPIIAPCFYGIDMSHKTELFAARYPITPELSSEVEAQMAADLDADTLRYLPRDAIARCVQIPPDQLCQACINEQYPTPAGEKLYQLALQEASEMQNLSDTQRNRLVEGALTSTSART